MKLVSCVSFVLIVLGVIILVTNLTPDKYEVVHNGAKIYSPNVWVGKELIVFGLATLTISEIFKNLKDTKSGGRHE